MQAMRTALCVRAAQRNMALKVDYQNIQLRQDKVNDLSMMHKFNTDDMNCLSVVSQAEPRNERQTQPLRSRHKKTMINMNKSINLKQYLYVYKSYLPAASVKFYALSNYSEFSSSLLY